MKRKCCIFALKANPTGKTQNYRQHSEVKSEKPETRCLALPALLVGTASAVNSDSVYLWAFVAFLAAALGDFFGPFFYPITPSPSL